MSLVDRQPIGWAQTAWTMPVMADSVLFREGASALVLDSPHSGTRYPDDFCHVCDLATLRRAEDTHVEKLYDFAPSLGVAWVEALFPRSYLDANRDLLEIDPSMLDGPWPEPLSDDARVQAKVRLGKGLIWRCTDDGVPLYDRRLGVDEVRTRIDRCWRPYHAALAQAVAAAHARHGYCIHINCHSMPAVAASHATDFPGLAHPDFVVGNRDHSTSSAELAEALCQWLRDAGHSVWLNHPYKGVEIVRRHSDPARHRHSIQLEINRGLYMDEATLEPTAGFAPLRQTLHRMVQWLLTVDPRAL